MSKLPDPDAAKARAEATFKPQQPSGAVDEARRAVDASKAAEAEKTARLRALRLAKEQSDRIAGEVRRARRESKRP